MARTLNLQGMDKDIRKSLARSFQSGHVNFLIGSGASHPAIPAAGRTEKEIADLFEEGHDTDARNRMYEFLSSIQEPTNRLISGQEDELNDRAVAHYTAFLRTLETILVERRTTLLPKQATVFTTNYDLFMEKASINTPVLRLNDGFSRVPSLDNRMNYSSRNFFNTTYNRGNLYDYEVEIPCVNLIKLHGSLSWRKEGDEIVFNVAQKDLLAEGKTSQQIEIFIQGYAVVLPQTTKFSTTLMDRTYYELLRIYANELDRENALLVTFGFSFGDEHIRDITRRALKNPTLRLIAFAYNDEAKDSLISIFERHNNVEIIAPGDEETIDFTRFNKILASFLPDTGGDE